ncbi:hypothetical protein C1645_837204 [Glomus cerebriforme]|uniref:Endonuclease/exonuclease/phosphatase domain-containing protein n=1 Tax=Glomus cerebriforme TaxID=658196 RepID=A0A397SAK2_9GLOM|nr:hypothetical protein C1645_837204 [Glomus cerebriforme]
MTEQQKVFYNTTNLNNIDNMADTTKKIPHTDSNPTQDSQTHTKTNKKNRHKDYSSQRSFFSNNNTQLSNNEFSIDFETFKIRTLNIRQGYYNTEKNTNLYNLLIQYELDILCITEMGLYNNVSLFDNNCPIKLPNPLTNVIDTYYTIHDNTGHYKGVGYHALT